MKLNQNNIQKSISDYITRVNTIEFPERRGTTIHFINLLKRVPLRSGPYPDVSFFEASNRILSDIVILYGIEQILTNPIIGPIQLPFSEYDIRLGIEGGIDIRADQGNQCLVGEAFNVAQSFFQTKKRAMIKKLQSEKKSDYKLLVFNADAVKRPEIYLSKSSKSMLFLPVDWQHAIEKFEKRSNGVKNHSNS